MTTTITTAAAAATRPEQSPQQAVSNHLRRLGHLHDGEDNPQGFAVEAVEPGAFPVQAVKLACGWFHARHDAVKLAQVLAVLVPLPPDAHGECRTEPEFWSAVRAAEMPEPREHKEGDGPKS